MDINEIYHSEDISIRTFNICKNNDLKDLTAILKHYRDNKTFENLKNCGKKSNYELTALCIKSINHNRNKIVGSAFKEKHLIHIITNFSKTQREIVNSFIEINSNYLSTRSQNVINSYLNGDLKIRNISDRILNNDEFNFQKIKNAGTKTLLELERFIDLIIEFIEQIAEIDNENDLLALKNRFFIEKTFSISSIPDEILKSQSIFSIVDFLISKKVIFEKNENIIFQKGLRIYEKQLELTIDELAEEISISKERVRQLRKSLLENLFTSLKFIKHINDDLYQKYSIDQNQNYIYIDNDLNLLINKHNNTNFSIQFNTFLIYAYISDEFDLIGEIEDVLLPKISNSRGRYNWCNFYLVNKKISSLFSFIEFANDLDKRKIERIDESYNFNFNSYLLNFSRIENLYLLNQISNVAEKILNNEFEIYVDTNDNICFIRNSLKQGYEYSYEALKLLGKPSKINEITKKIKELHPDYEINDIKVRTSLKRENGFVPIGRRSIFGLQEWEDNLENFKGGTIRSIVSEYLESETNPKHISKIAEYVLNYRPNTYERSILDNLKADVTGTFTFFKNSTIGLKSKKYDISYIELNKISSQKAKSWEERYKEFERFLNTNKRLPLSSGGTDEEIRLYRWYKVQEGEVRNGKLDNIKCRLLNQIIIQFNQNDSNRKRRSNNVERYINLKQFIRLNNRLPSANKTGEEYLYHFFYKQRKLFEKGQLNHSEKNQFIEITKIIQNNTYEN
jgi:hypothetical protein